MASDKAGIGRCGFAGPSSKLRDKPAGGCDEGIRDRRRPARQREAGGLMRFAHFEGPRGPGLAVDTPDGWRGHAGDDPRYPGDLLSLLTAGEDALIRAHALLSAGEAVDLGTVTLKPPVSRPGKII